MVFAVIGCCPPVSLLGGMLGVLAMQRIGASNGTLRGRKLARIAALTGIGLGAIGMFGWWRLQIHMHAQQREAIVSAVERLVSSAQSGDLAEARSQWVADRRQAISDDELDQFGQSLRARYGSFRSFSATFITQQPGMLTMTVDVAGTFSFVSGDRPGYVELSVVPGSNPLKQAMRVRHITIEDADDGPVQLPP